MVKLCAACGSRFLSWNLGKMHIVEFASQINGVHPGLHLQVYGTMFRRKFIDSLPSRANGKSLVDLLDHLTPEQISTAKGLSRRAQQELAKRTDLLEVGANYVEETLFLNICAGRYYLVWDLASRVKADPVRKRLITPNLYLLLLKLIQMKGDRSEIPLATKLYVELNRSGLTMVQEDHDQAATMLLDIFHSCCDFTQQLPLKIVYENYLANHTTDPAFEYRYIGAHMHILLNCGHYNQALQVLETTFQDVKEPAELRRVYENLPMVRMLDAMSNAHDCDNLAKWMNSILEHKVHIPYESWSEYLSIGLSLNHYELVKVVYSRLIMSDLDELLSAEDALFSNKVSALLAKSTVLASLGDKTLHEILHTLASNGDVDLTLNLIEWHYIHKTLKGEKALTQELCIDIISAYCNHYEPEANIGKTFRDTSVMQLLDVLDGFITKLGDSSFTYKDISDPMSLKFYNYQVYDENVAQASQRKANIFNTAKMSEVPSTPQKLSNSNISSSRIGNVFKNVKVLHQFVTEHIEYILERKYTMQTLQIFINCILSHINKYQNTSGLISALLAMRTLNANFVQDWLTHNLFDILIKSLARSTAAKLTGYELYMFLKQKQISISSENFADFISSSLRGEKYNSLLEFYVYEYSKLETVPSARILNILKGATLNERGNILVSSLEESQKQDLDKIWDDNSFTKSNPQIPEEPKESRYYYQIDVRDAGYLRYILFT